MKAWAEGVHYEGEVVTHAKALFQALRDTGKEPGQSLDWICLADRGLDGKDGRSLNVRGKYDPKGEYSELDVVTLNATWFVANRDSPGACPGPGWYSGPAGKKGEPGERGAPGPKGDPGKDASEIIEWHADRASYTIVPIYSDGKLGPPIPVRDLLEQLLIERGL